MLFILLRLFWVFLVFWGDGGGVVNSSCTDHRYGNPGKTCKRIKDERFQIRGVKIVPMWEFLLLNENRVTRHKRGVTYSRSRHLNVTSLNSEVRRSHLVRPPPLPIAPPRLNQIILPRRLHENHQQQVEPAHIYSMHVEAGRPILTGSAGRINYHPRSKKTKRQESYPTAPPEEEETTTEKDCKSCKKEGVVEELIEAQGKILEKALNIKPIEKEKEKEDKKENIVEELIEAQGKIIEEIIDKDKEKEKEKEKTKAEENHEVVMEILEAQGKILDKLKEDEEKKEKEKENKEVVETILEAQGKILENLKNVTESEKKEEKKDEKVEAVKEILETQGKIIENLAEAKKSEEEKKEKEEKIEAVGQILEAQEKILENLKNVTEAEKKKEEDEKDGKKEVVEEILEAQEKILESLKSSEKKEEEEKDDKGIVKEIIEAQEKVLKAALEVTDKSEEKKEEKDEKEVVGEIIEAQEKILKAALEVSDKKEEKETDVVKEIVEAQEMILKAALEVSGTSGEGKEPEEKEEKKGSKEVVEEILEAQEKILKSALKIKTQSGEETEGDDEKEHSEEKEEHSEEKEEEKENKKEDEEEEEEEEKEEKKKDKEKTSSLKGDKKKVIDSKEDKDGDGQLDIRQYADRKSHNSKMKVPVIRGKAVTNGTTPAPEESEWSPNIRDNEEPAEYADKPNIKYSYPPKDTLPLTTCFHNPSGYVCCNLELNNVVESTYKEVREDPAFNPCNLQVIANKVQRATEKMFDHPFETVVAHADFAQNVNFAGDLVCKLEVDGKYLIAYGTPFKADEALGPEGPNGEPVRLANTRFRF
ncbi:unnamed protein product [Caenorhabditis angaria]|uniref:Ground-like domain-containing protein n=1 Tax=Caenorhabditis angaria TaxID=860376 RepID=A0A9P1N9U7_9PELO|nr:unnamed protein product [Caenorhabditis angaria]